MVSFTYTLHAEEYLELAQAGLMKKKKINMFRLIMKYDFPIVALFSLSLFQVSFPVYMAAALLSLLWLIVANALFRKLLIFYYKEKWEEQDEHLFCEMNLQFHENHQLLLYYLGHEEHMILKDYKLTKSCILLITQNNQTILLPQRVIKETQDIRSCLKLIHSYVYS